ncbi:50S ribosomal protein L23 [Candidatus Pacearchaeota archaeon]|nr:50S ribosomal protein L23 [Candidatus Pacearchaeota archaeon]
MMPITTEKAVKILEKENTIIFCVDKRMQRQEIKRQIEDLWKVKVERINTLNKGNKKYAYAKLSKENPAIDLATKLGMI